MGLPIAGTPPEGVSFGFQGISEAGPPPPNPFFQPSTSQPGLDPPPYGGLVENKVSQSGENSRTRRIIFLKGGVKKMTKNGPFQAFFGFRVQGRRPYPWGGEGQPAPLFQPEPFPANRLEPGSFKNSLFGSQPSRPSKFSLENSHPRAHVPAVPGGVPLQEKDCYGKEKLQRGWCAPVSASPMQPQITTTGGTSGW